MSSKRGKVNTLGERVKETYRQVAQFGLLFNALLIEAPLR